jgi:hypothetical protein
MSFSYRRLGVFETGLRMMTTGSFGNDLMVMPDPQVKNLSP